MIDSHCHFDFSVFDDDREHLWQQAKQVGVKQLLIPGVTRAQWPRLLSVCENNADYYYALGLHPLFLSAYQADHINVLEQYLCLGNSQCLAVGEIGLDAVIDVPFELQCEVFDRQLSIAAAFDLPVLIHHRKTHHHIIRFLKRHKLSRGGVIHAFSGSRQDAEQYIEQGFLLGVGGTITYPRGAKTRRALEHVPMQHLLLETDAPDMPVCGYQGIRNTPEKLILIAQSLAQLKGISVDQVCRQTTQSFRALFYLDSSLQPLDH